MQLYATDKAIEFNSEYEKLERVLNALKEAHIDVSKERKKAVALKAKIDNEALNKIDPVEIETLYDNGIKCLKEINDSLKRYEIYFVAYNSASDIEQGLQNEKIGEEQLKAFAGVTISLLKRINSSDTRAFQSEEKVVDKVYDVSYGIIKLELLTRGTSSVLDWVKTDQVASNLIDTRIFEDIAKFPTDSTIYSEIRTLLANINRKTNITSGEVELNYTALDEGLILFLALQDSQNIERIESSLFATLNEINDLENAQMCQGYTNEKSQNKIDSLTAAIKKSHIYKEIALALGLIGLVIGIKQGSEALAPNFGHNEYKTHVDYYSSVDGEVPEYPEYMRPFKHNSKTTLKAYGPWNQEGIFYGDYERSVVEFDLSDLDLENLEDFASIDFSELAATSEETETAEELDSSMLYEKAIVEITRITQDPNDKIFVPNETAKEIFLTVISFIDAALAIFGGGLIIINIISKIKKRFENGSLRKTELASLAEGLKRYEELSNKNEEFKKRLIESYKKYSEVINNAELKSKCEGILRWTKND